MNLKKIKTIKKILALSIVLATGLKKYFSYKEKKEKKELKKVK